MSRLATIALVLILVLVVAVVIAWVLGAKAPREHVATLTRDVALPPHALYALLRDVDAYPSWRSGVKRVRRERADRWVEYSRHGAIPYRIVDEVADTRRVVAIDDPTLPYGGTWTFEIAPQGAGSRLSITEHGNVSHPLMRFVSTFFVGHERTMRTFLDDLAGASAPRPAASGAPAPTN